MDTINRNRKCNRHNDNIPDDLCIDDISVKSSGNKLIFMTITMIRVLSTALAWLVM